MHRAAAPIVELLLASVALILPAAAASAQVHYHEGGQPWNQRAGAGPDAEVPGWYYNLGITGMRAELVADAPKSLVIRYVFANSPAHGQVRAGDHIIGAGGRPFREAHRNGYGEAVFGATGPIEEFATALEAAQDSSAPSPGQLTLTVLRAGKQRDVTLKVGTTYGCFGADYPAKCAKSERIAKELLAYLVQHQRDDGSFGDPVHDTFAPLALLSSGDPAHLPAVERCVRRLCAATKAIDAEAKESLPNWRYMGAALVLSEYYLATRAAWVLPELQEIHDFIAAGQYLDMSQINPRAKESHPDSFPKGPLNSHGGWGHNPGFEGYGPIAMITAQGALAYSMMARCGIEIDRTRHDAAYAFLRRGSGKNGYVWYGDGVGGRDDGWADMGRTGAAAIANAMSPYQDTAYGDSARWHASVIGAHPQSFPDTHGSPPMGMGYTALGGQRRSGELPRPDGCQSLVVRARPVHRRELLLPAEPGQRRLRRRCTHDGFGGDGVHAADPEAWTRDHGQGSDARGGAACRSRSRITAAEGVHPCRAIEHAGTCGDLDLRCDGWRSEDRAAAQADAWSRWCAARVRADVDLVGGLPGRCVLRPDRGEGHLDCRVRCARGQDRS
jgi:hypothetical protein